MSTNSLIIAVALLFPGVDRAAPIQPVHSVLTTAVPERGSPRVWSIKLQRETRDYTIEMRAGPRWAVIASGHRAPLSGIVLPTAANDGRPLRITGTFLQAGGNSIAPNDDVVRQRTLFLAMMALFFGFFVAMGIVNGISWLLVRSAASAWYTGIAGSMALTQAFSAGAFRFLSDGNGLLEPIAHSILVGSFMICVVGFGISLLRALSLDRIVAWAAIGVCAINVVLIFFEDLYSDQWPLYGLDQGMLDLMIVLQVVMGIRALMHGGAPFARSYLIAFAGPVAGLPVNDLATHNVFAYWLTYAFEFGVAWEAMFFSYAVALSNRRLIRERDLLDTMAHFDALTGIGNRRAFDEALERAWSLSRKSGTPLAMIMIDIDRFKMLNDTQGHRYGDEVLCSVAKTCAAITTRSGDCFARYGGEEFAAVLVGTEIEGAEIVADRMRSAVEAGGVATISAGVAVATALMSSADELVAASDAALYNAKESGRNQVCRAEAKTA